MALELHAENTLEPTLVKSSDENEKKEKLEKSPQDRGGLAGEETKGQKP